MGEKIYLIDDNLDGNRQKYGGDFIDEGLYQDVLVVIDKLSISEDLSFIENASCILLHKSFEDFYDGIFHDDSHKVVSVIRKHPDVGNTIPLVLFSDGDTNDFGDYRNNTIYSLSKRAFYGRLEMFVDLYHKQHNIELNLLAYGPDYVAYLADRISTSLFVRLQDMNDDENLPAPKIHCEDMKQLVSISQPLIGKSYKEIIIDLQMNPISVKEFKSRINNILESIQEYGKNYFTWE